MNEKHIKSFRAAFDYWFEDKPLNEAVSSLHTEEINENVTEEPVEKKEINEGFDAHVLCNSCGSGNLKLSRKKSKIKCSDCGNTGLTESITGLNEMARTKEQFTQAKTEKDATVKSSIVAERKSIFARAEKKIDTAMDSGLETVIVDTAGTEVDISIDELKIFLKSKYPDFKFKVSPLKDRAYSVRVTWS